MSERPLWLRILQINDVYELDNFPSFQTLVQEKKQGPDETLVILAGDFLAPSLLSSLDHGAAMVDCMNRVGVTHVCFGNHECDVPMEALKKRITEQSNFQWINSNMQELNTKLNLSTPEHDIVTVASSHGKSQRVGVLGLLTDEEGLYRPGTYANAKIEPVIESAERVMQKLNGQVDFWLPMTHQSVADDRVFAQHFGSVFPIVLGGHDHNVIDETVNGCHIVKAGFDANHTVIVDIQWTTDQPLVSAEIVETNDFAPDAHMKSIVDCHWQLIRELERAKLFRVHQWTDGEEFSTRNNRLGPTHGSSALTTMLRMGLQTQCCLLNAGSIRGNEVYPSDSFFTFSDLKAEVPFPTPMVVMYVPGKILEATIRFSRQPSRQSPPVANGSYIHTCNNIEYNDETQCIESIEGAPMLPEQLYLTALNSQFLLGIDNLEPLLDWVAANNVRWKIESAVPAKLVLVELLSALLWLQLGSFSDMDLDGNGVLTRDEIQASVSSHFRESSVADLIVDNVMSIADLNGDGVVSPLEMIIVQLVATDMLTYRNGAVDDDEWIDEIKSTAAQVLGLDNADDEQVFHMVENIRKMIYVDETGSLKRVAHEKTLGELRRRSLLI